MLRREARRKRARRVAVGMDPLCPSEAERTSPERLATSDLSAIWAREVLEGRRCWRLTSLG